MRIPDGWLRNLAFFGGKNANGMHCRATVFLIGQPTARTPMLGQSLVTARHNVLKAQEEYGNTWIRLNTKEGGTIEVEVKEPWQYPDDPAIDIAAVPFRPPDEAEIFPMPVDWFATPEVVKTTSIGVGDELFVVGLFSHRVGTNRNEPIVRNGNLAAMPLEPLLDEGSGEPYSAYLAEIRSIGGLSGSPVVVSLNPATRASTASATTTNPTPCTSTFSVSFEDIGGSVTWVTCSGAGRSL